MSEEMAEHVGIPGLPTSDQLTHLLQQSGALTTGQVQRVSVSQQFQGYADAILRLQLTYSSAADLRAPRTLIGKIFGPQWYAASGQPELRFYRDLAPQMPQIPVPSFYGGLDDPSTQTCLLLIEDLAEQYAPVKLPLAMSWVERLVDLLVDLHTHWWEHPALNAPEFLVPEQAVTRMPQALDSRGLRVNATYARQALEQFSQQHAAELTVDEQDLLHLLATRWGERFQARVELGQAITLLHGDFHLLGNVFLAQAPTVTPPIKILDWTQAKRGLGPHDLMYMLLALDAPDRVARDTHLLRRYHAGLLVAGCTGYDWDQCLWDYRFSLLTNLFQAFFQASVHWFRKTVTVVQAWHSADLLT